MRIVALIPAFNEESHIVQTLTAVEKIKLVEEIVVVNDGSVDDTLALALQFQKKASVKTTVLNQAENQGKGAALNYGLANVAADIYLLLDADLGDTAVLAVDLLEPVLTGEAQMSIARFVAGQSSAKSKMGFGVVRRTAVLGVRLLTGVRVSSPLSGQRAVKSEVLQSIGQLPTGFGVEVSLTVGALHHGFQIVEVPLAMKHRAYGRGFQGFKHRGQQMIHVLQALWSCWKKGWHQ
ncbi:MAG: glycosyltransferase family 2 protein [Firmicutes bacterium]|nr:glycosyltransferase family 2 protein [Bacillota bacterium]